MSAKQYFWDEEGNRVHRARGKLKSGVWYTPIVLASDYDALLVQRDARELQAEIARELANRLRPFLSRRQPA